MVAIKRQIKRFIHGFMLLNLMPVTLLCTVSENGNLIFSIDGDLPRKSYRGEGKLELDLVSKSCEIEGNEAYFSSGYHLSGGRGLLAALFIFHPTWNALGSYKEMIHMGFKPTDKKTIVRTNLDFPDHMVDLLSNDWMLPNLEFEYIGDKEKRMDLETENKPSLAYGGGLDSGAAISLLQDDVDSYYIANSSPCDIRQGTRHILNNYSGNVIHTNVRRLYSTTGFPHWMIPYVPSLLRGDKYCLTGSILESQYLRDGAGYNNSTGNLWIRLLRQCGVTALPLSCHSEYTNAFIVAKSGNIDHIAGNCTDEWGYGYKALRKAVLLRPFEERFESIINDIESKGFVLSPKFKFTQPSKMLTSISKSAIMTASTSTSKSVNILRKFEPHSNLPWAFKYHPDTFDTLDWPEAIMRRLNQAQESLGILPMNSDEIDVLKSYKHEEFLEKNYSTEFISEM